MSYRDRGTKIYVGNLSSTTTRSDLEYEFGYYGHLVNVWVAKNPPGFSYVEFEDARDADDAIKGLDGRELHGRRIRVERSHGMPRSRRDDGGRFGSASRRPFHPTDRCYNCGENGHYAYDCDLYSRRSRGSDRRHNRRSYSRSRTRSRTPKRRTRRSSRSYSRSRSHSPRRRTPSGTRSRSYTPRSGGKRSRSPSRSPQRNNVEGGSERNGDRSPS